MVNNYGTPSFGTMLRTVISSTVKVTTPSATGSCFYIGNSEFVTAGHLVEGMEPGDQVTLTNAHGSTDAQVRGCYPSDRGDVAILSAPCSLPPAAVGRPSGSRRCSNRRWLPIGMGPQCLANPGHRLRYSRRRRHLIHTNRRSSEHGQQWWAACGRLRPRGGSGELEAQGCGRGGDGVRNVRAKLESAPTRHPFWPSTTTDLVPDRRISVLSGRALGEGHGCSESCTGTVEL